MSASSRWYIVKQASGMCQIIQTDTPPSTSEEQNLIEQWGPYGSQGEAIARRVGLIRAGKCEPA
ncbi:MAG: DDE transposase family protein [Cyanobacteria bacterium P01_H01_bin.58]